MVKVKGTKGNVVNIEVRGIGEVTRMLKAKNLQIEVGADFGVVRAGAFIEGEVKESIIGNRAEPKSVDTGRLADSVEFKKTGFAEGKVIPTKKRYPNSKATTDEVAVFMEYGTTKRPFPRRHFGNTKARNKDKIKGFIETEVRDAAKR